MIVGSEMIERVARAMCRERHPCWSIVGEIFDRDIDGQATEFRSYAIAALQALMEPTPGMVEAGFDAAMGEISDDFDRIEVQSVIGRTVLKAMIRAAVEEGEGDGKHQ